MLKKSSASAKPSSSSGRDYLEIRLPRFSFRDTPINSFLVLALVILAFALGMLTNKVFYLEKEAKNSANQKAQQQETAPQVAPTEDATPKKVSIDDDPVLGDKNAKVTLIEFSDYECPFCKSYFDKTYEQIKKDYVEKGLVKIVFRDLPLSFHDPMATVEAVAANCAREQGDDSTYFKYHDEIFKRTKSNGNGLNKDDLNTIAADLGLEATRFTTCVNEEKNKEEVQKDLADAGSVGASGTPTFFIGKSTNDGVILGTKLVGAQPFSEFQRIIEQELKK